MTMITRTIRSLEAQQIIKDALAANSVEMHIEAQGNEHFVSFAVQIPAGQVAYSAYRVSRGGKAHDGSPLPTRIDGEMLLAWDAFAYAVLEGLGVDRAYQHYLAARKGCDYVGGPAPDWDELRNAKPDIAAAWADAANALPAAL
jgi:hypothetical protein